MTSGTPMTPTNLQIGLFALGVLQFLWSAGLSLYVIWSNKKKVSNDRLEERDKAADQRMTEAETELKLMSQRLVESDKQRAELGKAIERLTKQMQHQSECKYHQSIEVRLDAMNGAINKIEGVVEGRMEGIGNALDLIQEHLLRGGKQ